MRCPKRTCRRSGFTLIEIVTSIGILSVLMWAMLSTMLIASKAIGSSDSKIAKISQGNNILQRITADLSLAQSFSERTATAVTFTVPDRNGDGSPETIRYAWSGTAGDPLTYQYNGGTVVNLAQDVHAFDLDYLLKTVTAAASQATAPETEEMELVSHDYASVGTWTGYSSSRDMRFYVYGTVTTTGEPQWP